MSTRPVLVVQHEDGCPPAWFGTWMSEAGAVLDVRRPYAGDALPADLAGHGGLLVLGGSMNATDEVATPWLAPTKALVREAVAARTPLLGICLGHQIAADALGGTVLTNPAGVQRGLLDIGWMDASDDPLFGSLPVRAAHWNSDIVAIVPPGARVLAIAPGGELQALRLGERAWSIQSHPEVDEKLLRIWSEEEWSGGAQDAAAVEEFLAQVVREWEALVTWWRPVAMRFARLSTAAQQES